jgi:hypothetical protein
MRFIAVAIAVATIAAGVGTAHAEPTPEPTPPGYQLVGPSGPEFPGVQVYPPRCRWQPRSCGLEYDPGTGTWNPSDPGGV